MRLLIGSTSPIMSSCKTVMSPCGASCHLCSREHSFPVPGWWGNSPFSVPKELHPWSRTRSLLTWPRRSAAYLRFSVKVVSISPATAARSAPRGTRPAIRWILQTQRDQPQAAAPVSKHLVGSNKPSFATGKQCQAGAADTEGGKRSHLLYRKHNRLQQAAGTQAHTIPPQYAEERL